MEEDYGKLWKYMMPWKAVELNAPSSLWEPMMRRKRNIVEKELYIIVG